MARFLRTTVNFGNGRFAGHSRLSPPVVVNSAIIAYGPGVKLVDPFSYKNLRRRDPTYKLRPPAVLAAAPAVTLARPIMVNLNVQLPAQRRERVTRRSPDYELKPPTAVNGAIIVYGPGVRLTNVRSIERSKYQTFVLPSYPVLVNPAVIFRGVQVYLNPDLPHQRFIRVSKRRPNYFLREPISAVSFIARPIQITLTNVRSIERIKYRTFVLPPYPVLVNPATVFRPISINLNVQLPVQRRERATKRSPDYELKPPTVINGAIIFPGLRIRTADSTRRPRRATSFKTNPPIIVAAEVADTASGFLAVILAPSSRLGRLQHSRLGKPTYIAGYFRPVKTALTYSRRGVPKSVLKKPTVIAGAIIYRPIKVTFAPSSKLGRVQHSKLGKPTYIAGYFRPVQTHLTYSRRGAPKSKLEAPIVIDSAAFYSGPKTLITRSKRPETQYRLIPPVAIVVVVAPVVTDLTVQLAYSRRGRPDYKLSAPTVVNGAIVYRPVQTKLAPSSGLGRIQHSKLGTPSYIAGYFAPIKITLAVAPDDVGYKLSKRAPHSKLQQPTVVDGAIIFPPLRIKTADSTRISRKAISKLQPPTYIAGYFRPVMTHLAYSVSGKPKSRLQSPTVVDSAIVYAPVFTKLAPSSRLGRVPHFKLQAPTVVAGAIVYAPVITHLTYSRRGKPKNFLAPPVTVAPQFFPRPLSINLAPSSRGVPKSKLRPPTRVLGAIVFRPIEISIASQKPIQVNTNRAPHSKLKPPAVIGAARVFRPIQTTFLPAVHRVEDGKQRRAPHSILKPPAVVRILTFFGPFVHLAPSTRGKPKSVLHAPVVIDSAVIYRPVQTVLVGSHKLSRAAHSELKPPTRVNAAIVFAPVVTRFAPSSRAARATHPVLRLPTIVAGATVFRPIITSLAPSRFGKPQSILRKPIVVAPEFFARPIQISLAPSFRGTPKSRIAPPTVVAPEFFARPLTVALAPSFRGIPESKLTAPIVIAGAVVFRPISITIAKQNLVQDRLTRVARPQLLPPAVVFTGSQKGYHSRTKINDRESTLVITLKKPQLRINDRESNTSITKRGTSRDRINDRESDLDIS